MLDVARLRWSSRDVVGVLAERVRERRKTEAMVVVGAVKLQTLD